MEQVHETFRRPWITAETIDLVEFRDNVYSSVCHKFDITGEYNLSFDERMIRIYTNEELEEREEACGVSLLDCEGEELIEFGKDFELPEDNVLQTLMSHAREVEKRKVDLTHKNLPFHNSRFKHYCNSLELVPRRKDPSCEPKFLQIRHPEILLTVQIFRPEMQFFSTLEKSTINNMRAPTFHVDQQFQVVGCQFLTEMRDLIICQSDASVVGDVSDNPGTSTSVTCEEIYRSGFFYINGVFYNDMRDPMNKEYSENIIEWSKTASGVGPFSTALMENTKFIDLHLQLGLPYLYLHQGHCEHMVVFSDLRLLNSKDSQNRYDYPQRQILQPTRPITCMACKKYVAKYITTEDTRMCELPYFSCDKCFSAFNYDENGKKVSEFKAYKYLDKTAIL